MEVEMTAAAILCSIILLLVLFFIPVIAVPADEEYPEFGNNEEPSTRTVSTDLETH